MNPRLSKKLIIDQVGGNGYYFVLDPDIPSWVIVNNDGLEVLKLCDGRKNIQVITEQALDKLKLKENKNSGKNIQSFLQAIHESGILNNKIPEKIKVSEFRGVALEITNKCNLNCRHCYLSAGEKGDKELTLDEIKNLLNDVKEAGGISVAIGGGEPLMREDWYEIIQHALTLDLLVSIGTNGTLIDRQIAQKLTELGIKVQISMDGATAETHDSIRGKGSYKKVLTGIDNLIKEGGLNHLVLAFTPMKPNVQDVAGIIEFALDRQIHVIQFPPLTASGRASERWQQLRLSDDEMYTFWGFIAEKSRELKGRLDLLADCFSIDINNIGQQRRCSIGTQFRIAPDGNVYPCQCFHFGEDYCLGNVRVKNLKDIVLGNKIKQIKNICYNRPHQIPECKECKWINFCGGGCMGNIFESSGNIYEPESCEVRKKWIERLFNEKFEKVRSLDNT